MSLLFKSKSLNFLEKSHDSIVNCDFLAFPMNNLKEFKSHHYHPFLISLTKAKGLLTIWLNFLCNVIENEAGKKKVQSSSTQSGT